MLLFSIFSSSFNYFQALNMKWYDTSIKILRDANSELVTNYDEDIQVRGLEMNCK